jgi:hypothetical protein
MPNNRSNPRSRTMPPIAPHTIDLDQPIKRDGQEIGSITLRKPAAGELRGLLLLNVLNMEVDTLATLLPRIATPTIHKAEVLAMDPADILAAGIEIAGFLQQKGKLTDSQTA